MTIELDIPDIKVLVRTDPNYNVVIQNPRSTVYRSGSYISVSESALSSSYAVTSSYAHTINRQISGSIYVTGSATITDDLSVEGTIFAEKLLVSSSVIYESGSTKFGDSLEDTHQFTGSILVDGNLISPFITGTLYGTASVAEGIHIVFAGEYQTGSDGVVIPIPSGGLSYITSASYALTASYFDNNTWNNLLNKPEGLVSSSVQVFYFPVQTAISSSYATTASYAMNGGGGGGGSGTSGTAGSSGTSGINGSSGTSGQSGSSGSSGTSGLTGSSGTSGVSGILPDGVVSGSQQILNYNIFATTGSNNFVGNQTVTGSFTVSGSATFTNIGPAVFSGSATTTEQFVGSLLGTSSWANSAANVNYENVTNKPTLVSASSQISYPNLSSIPQNIVSSSAQVTAFLPSNVVSSSTQVSNYNVFASTGSNIFKADQTITGSLYITSNLIVQGSSSVSYVSQSTLNIGTNLITVNVQNPSVRFGGLAAIDSESSPRVSGSLLFDSVENQWLYIHQNQNVVTSSILIMGPQTYNNVGNETHPTTNRVMKSLNDEHIGDSQITDDGTTVSIPGNLTVTGTVSGSQFSGRITGSLFGTSSFAVTSSYVTPTGLPVGLISSSAQVGTLGNIRLQVGTNRSNSSAFYFNSNTRLAGDSSSPTQDTAFLIQSTGLSTITIYMRQSNSGPNNVIVGVAKNANGTAFSGATLLTSSSLSLAADTIQTYTFSGLTLSQFDSIHIYCSPTSTPGNMFAVVLVN